MKILPSYKKILLITILFLISLSFVSAIHFDIPLGYHQTSSRAGTIELENELGDHILVAADDYLSYQDMIAQLDDEYTIGGYRIFKIDNVDVSEYRLYSQNSVKIVYRFRYWGHNYSICASPNNILSWRIESRTNPVNHIISSFIGI